MRFGKSSLQYALAPPMPLSSIGIQRIFLNTSYNGNVPQLKTHLDIHGAGLSGKDGASEVIKLLIQNPTIEHLILGNNKFGDDGITLLFTYLSSPLGQSHKIIDISLNSCAIGNAGFDRIADYLDGNTTLQSLFLQNNAFNPSLESTVRFTSAINNSKLQRLSLTSNKHLSDAFLFRFLPILNSPYLQELHLSAMGLTHFSTPHICKFLAPDDAASQPQSLEFLSHRTRQKTRIRDLRLNGNHLSLDCFRRIVDTVKTSNFSLLHLELFANEFETINPGPTSNSANNSIEDYQHYSMYLLHSVARNQMVTQRTAQQALQLLTPARVLLLPPRGQRISNQPASYRPTMSAEGLNYSPAPFPWRSLPTELQLYILQFVSPSLSDQQYIRIWKYAESWDTLEKVQLPKPGLTGVFGFGTSYGSVPREPKTKKQKQDEWLFKVECDRFEHYPGWLEDAFDWFNPSNPLAKR